MSNDKAAMTDTQSHSAEDPTSPSWTIGYSEWENITNPATVETVAEAEASERDGWPYPISGDQTAIRRPISMRPITFVRSPLELWP